MNGLALLFGGSAHTLFYKARNLLPGYSLKTVPRSFATFCASLIKWMLISSSKSKTGTQFISKFIKTAQKQASFRLHCISEAKKRFQLALRCISVGRFGFSLRYTASVQEELVSTCATLHQCRKNWFQFALHCISVRRIGFRWCYTASV